MIQVTKVMMMMVIMMKLQLEAEERLDWICLLNENTELDLKNLNDLVQKKSLKPREDSLFFGRALQDMEPTIIHHFSQDKLLYPDLEAGVFMSRRLVLELWTRMKDAESLAQDSHFPSDFNIDPAYEFAKFVLNEVLYSAVLYCTLLYYILQLGEGRDSGKYCSDLHQEGLRLRHLLQE